MRLTVGAYKICSWIKMSLVKADSLRSTGQTRTFAANQDWRVIQRITDELSQSFDVGASRPGERVYLAARRLGGKKSVREESRRQRDEGRRDGSVHEGDEVRECDCPDVASRDRRRVSVQIIDSRRFARFAPLGKERCPASRESEYELWRSVARKSAVTALGFRVLRARTGAISSFSASPFCRLFFPLSSDVSRGQRRGTAVETNACCSTMTTTPMARRREAARLVKNYHTHPFPSPYPHGILGRPIASVVADIYLIGMGLVLFEVPGIIRQRAVSEGGRGAMSAAVAVVSTRNGARADPHRGN